MQIIIIIFHAQIQTDESGERSVEILEDDSRELVDFLHHIEPYMSECLKRNLRSHAFDGTVLNQKMSQFYYPF